MKINYKSINSPFKVKFYNSKRDSTVEMARMVMAMLVTFTHMYAFTSLHGHQDAGMLAKTFKTLGGMCTVVFMMFSGYYYAGKPGKGRWFKVLMSWIVLLILNWVLSAIWVTASGWLYVGGDNSHLVSSDYFWSHPMGRHGWLNLLVVGNDTHWYMWQFIIAMVFYPFITLGLKTYSKKAYLFTAVGLLSLDTLFKVLIGLGFLENSLGGFIGNYGADTNFAPWNGYSWVLMLVSFIFAGYLKMHHQRTEKGSLKKSTMYFGIVLALVLGFSALWAYGTVGGVKLNRLSSGYGTALVDGYGTYLTPNSAAALHGGSVAETVNNYNNAKGALDALTTPSSGNPMYDSSAMSISEGAKDYAKFYNITGTPAAYSTIDAKYSAYEAAKVAYDNFNSDNNAIQRFNWLGFLEMGNYVPTMALFGACLIFLGIMNLPQTHNKVAGFLGSLSFAYYALHMFIVTAVIMMFNATGFYDWVTDGSTTKAVSDGFGSGFNSNYIKDAVGGKYILTILVIVLFSIPFAILGTYIMKVVNGIMDPYYNKLISKFEKKELKTSKEKEII